MGDWTFFSNYGHVMVCLARNREVRLRDVAAEVGITERAVQKIVRDLQDAGYLTISKQGRCNRYRINRRKTLRHALESHCTVGKLLTLVGKPRRKAPVAQDNEVPDNEVIESPATAPEPGSAEQSPLLPQEEAKKPEKEEKNTKPLDTREQGNLF